MDHLALAVTDQERSRRFYERYLGFTAEPTPRSDGVRMMHGAGGFSLALGETTEPVQLPTFLHFGQRLASSDDVRAFRDRLIGDDVEIAGWWEEPDYVSVKFRDPDGYVVEVSWEPRSVVRVPGPR
jgi:catechol 2,3-dioxygenase-like lactoylglutathione lyase family enzyme